ncbi:hypothetical protein [Croceicoccus mobilis]|uniref:Uncharacterized protein n=1 Tax=Croceicoccus mobilis TaxID=1703339 RepID=A0A916YPI8_9SPHN|nr:hypothetical protein [Croceicoccus mobilis]GGD55074.1 hypothetical protein GCM10010990_00240 [Croceicoccus mobilis]
MPKGSDPFALASSAWWLWAESWFVIWSRTMLIATGDANGQREASRMVMEKLEANAELGMKLMTGQLGYGDKAVKNSLVHYGRKVSANRRRLSGQNKSK